MIVRLIEKSDAHTRLLGGKERLKQMGEHSVREGPAPCLKPRISTMPSRTRALATVSSRSSQFRHRLHRVAQQIDQHLLDLHAIGHHEIVCRIEVEFQQDPGLARAHEAKRRRLFDKPADALDAPLGFPAQHKFAKAADDLPGADGLFGRFVERRFDRRRIGIRCWRRAVGASLSCNC